MAGRVAVKNAVVAYLAPGVTDSDALTFLYWVYYRWVNEATLTGLDMRTEWFEWIRAGKPYIETGQGTGLTWAAIKAL